MIPIIEKESEEIEAPLERFRRFDLKFDRPLPELVLKNLINEKQFYSKYNSIKTLKVDDEIQALMIESSAINYTVNNGNIQAQSAYVENCVNIEDGLKSMADIIIDIYDLDFGYTVKRGVDFRYIEDFDLQSVTNGSKLNKNLKNEFQNNIFPLSAKYIYKTKSGDNLLFNIGYANSNDLKNKRLLIEVNEEYIDRLYGALKDE